MRTYVIRLLLLFIPTLLILSALVFFCGACASQRHRRHHAVRRRRYMQVAPWLAMWPGIFLTIVVYGFNMFGDAMRDLLDPRLRGGAGRISGPRARARIRTTAAERGITVDSVAGYTNLVDPERMSR